MNKETELIHKAYCVLDGEPITRELADELAQLDGLHTLDLVSLANKVRAKFTPDIHACTIMNAKSGECSEDCRFCAQSAHHDADIETFPLASPDEIVNRARIVHDTGVNNFGIVTSGYGFTELDDTFKSVLHSIDLVQDTFPEIKVCASLGILSEQTVTELAKRKIQHYNINLQTNPNRYKDLISTTHEIADRVRTIKLLQEHGIGVCCGGILGLGESMQDRVELAYALKELDVDVIPLNVLIPIEGTPLENNALTSPAEIARSFAIFRLINPTKTIKFAAGRETRMKDFQGLLMLAGVNGMLTGGYLTTRGRNTEDDESFIEDLKSFN
ncbi:biotin synthase BioB [bacterium E08(2017)]|nr:biotin synthase BioB [bacterium E08(2017)]